MTDPQQFTQVLHNWAEIFMRRSMRDFIQSSKDSGLSVTQLSTLFRLHHKGFCGVSEVGDHLGITHAAASQMVERLVQLRLLERAEDPRDRRVKHLTLTVKGQELVQESIQARRRWMEELTNALTPQEHGLIIDALTILTAAARQLETSKKMKDE
ncbi:MAG TPA: MarR family transcriptional regulator [Anaerolineales bacterium]|nr:MarR family transcriptional regulator [Anaerolineales bacterium]